MSCENYSLPEKQVKSKPKIQQTLDFERPALVDAMEFLQASQIPKPGTEQQFTTFAHTQLRPRTAHRPPATLQRGISHGQTCGVLTYTHKPITSDLQDPKTGR